MAHWAQEAAQSSGREVRRYGGDGNGREEGLEWREMKDQATRVIIKRNSDDPTAAVSGGVAGSGQAPRGEEEEERG